MIIFFTVGGVGGGQILSWEGTSFSVGSFEPYNKVWPGGGFSSFIREEFFLPVFSSKETPF